MRSGNKNPDTPPRERIKDELAQEEGVLARWSRRKQQAVVESDIESSAPQPSEAALAEPEQPVLTDADMPPVEDLGENSDYSGFMSSGVSEQLRAIALRKLFRGAKFNICDGLDDYDDDFRAVTLLKDVLIADAKDKLEKTTEQESESEQTESDTNNITENEQSNADEIVEADESLSANDDELSDESDDEEPGVA